MATLTAAEFDAIRAAISSELDSNTLPNDVIAQPIFLTASNSWLSANDSQAATRADAELRQLQRAGILYCAGLIAPTIPQLISGRDGQLARTLAERDMNAHAQNLFKRATAELDDLLSQTSRPTFFGSISGTRGK